MTNKFLLNLLGFNPDLTSRQPRVDYLSLVSRQSDLLTYLGRIAAIFLLVLTIGVGNAWGVDATATLSTLYDGWTSNTSVNNDSKTFGTYFTVTWTKEDSPTNPTYLNNSDGNGVKLYATKNTAKGGKMTISTSTSGVYITNISIAGKKTQGTVAFYWDGNTSTTGYSHSYTEASKTQSAYARLKETGNSKNGQYHITSITVTYVTAAPAAKYTVSFDVGAGSPSQADIAEASAGAGITLPTGPTPTCSGDGWSFAGWQETSAVTSETTIAPTLLSAGSTYHPSENVTLYAVYRKSFPNYTKITNQSDLTTGDNYIIVANYSTKNYVMTNSYSTSGDYGRLAGSQIDETSTGVYSSASISSSYVFTITGSSNQWFVYNSTDSKYVDAGYKSFYLTKYDDADYWAITASAGAWSFVNHYNSNYIYYNGSSNIFSGESTSASLLLYKYSAYKYFSNPTCCTPLGSINGSFLWTAYFIARKPFCRAA